MGRVRKVVLKEWVKLGVDSGYWAWWYGSVPPDDVAYIVTDQEWGTAGDCPDQVRHIYEWEVPRGADEYTALEGLPVVQAPQARGKRRRGTDTVQLPEAVPDQAG